MVSEELYSNYVRRRPHARSERFISNWHMKLLGLALENKKTKVVNVLEIGPGHGYFAQHCISMGMTYEFIDNSKAVFAHMTSLGVDGYLGLIDEVAGQIDKKFDLIWMSNVLEHSPTWVNARNLIDDSSKLLAENGSIAIIGPDAILWGRQFWNIDATHGYPTTLRNVIQLCDDVGLQTSIAKHHRNASFSFFSRSIFVLLSCIPHNWVDRVLSPARARHGDGYLISWKAVFGWRQIFVMAEKRN